MAEIAVLKTHIINYAKTREVYVAYRKAGYSKKFAAEHESALLLHKAAKQFFDEAGLKRLPTVKSLQAEYSQLLREKKAAYGEYRQAREEMKEFLTVKANVDNLLEIEDGRNKEKTNQREPRRSAELFFSLAQAGYKRFSRRLKCAAVQTKFGRSKGFGGVAPDPTALDAAHKRNGLFGINRIGHFCVWVPRCPACDNQPTPNLAKLD